MLDIGLSSCGKPADRAFFDGCAGAGIRTIEVSPSSDAYDDIDYAGLRALSDCSGVGINSFHLPFYPFDAIDISALDDELRGRSVVRDAELIRKASQIGIALFVIHASGEPIKPDERAQRFELSRESLSRLSRIAKENGAVLAVEDLPRSCLGRDSAEINALCDADENLMICFDTNHLLGETISDFIKNTSGRIVTTHVSDYDFIDERHLLPGEGKIDWRALYGELTGTGYRGPWLYELSFHSGSRPRERDLTYSDIVRNAREIFGGRELTVLPTAE